VLDSTGVATLADMVRQQGAARPDRIAIRFEGRSISYGDLDRRANQVANALIAAGIRRQSRIALLASYSLAFFELWFGAAKIDAVLVPVNFRLAPPEIAFVVNDAKAELLFVSPDFYPAVEKIALELKTVRATIALAAGHSAWPDYESWVADHSGADP